MSRIGILNPGAMGVSIAASARDAGHHVYWSSAGRSQATRQRAAAQNLIEVDSLAQLCRTCDVILSVCPPHAAESVAQSALAADFRGLYCDGNAISPPKAQRIGAKLTAAGIDFVDGSIVGPPAWKVGATRFYLSGGAANRVADLFAGSLTEAMVIGEDIGRASALKMVFAAQTKGYAALLSAIQAAAEQLGVRDDLAREWGFRDPNETAQTENRVRSVTSKAWRFAGEMDEIAETFDMAGIPSGFFVAAAEVYTRLAGFKDADETPPLDEALAALMPETKGKDE